jgi:hypothetical protein
MVGGGYNSMPGHQIDGFAKKTTTQNNFPLKQHFSV